MSRIFITIGSAHSKAANVNPVDGIWCSDCGWAGRVEEDMTDSEDSEEPLFEEEGLRMRTTRPTSSEP